MANIGEKLRLARVEAGMTVRQAAEASGRSKDSISKIERGLQDPTPLTIGKLAGAYSVGVGDFLADLPPKKALAPPPGQRSFDNYIAEEERRTYSTIREIEHVKGYVSTCIERWGRVARGEEPNLVPDHSYSIEVSQHVIALINWFGQLLRIIEAELPPETAISEQREIIGLIDQLGAVTAQIGAIADVAEGIAAEAVDEEAQALIDAEVKAFVAEREPTDQLAQRRAEHSQRRYEDLSEVQRRAAEVKRLAAGE